MSEPIRILLVDDEALVLSSLRRLLARRGFDVVTAPSGAAALEKLASAEFDIVLTDYKMPGMTGAELLEQVTLRWPNLHRCMLTAQADPDVVAKAIANGVIHRAFRKPWDNAALVEALKTVAAS